MANAVEAVGQDVHQKAADEFVYWQRHGLDPCAAGRLAAGAIILPAEGDAVVVRGDETAV